jgi:small-conductance mechanosensitive channel
MIEKIKYRELTQEEAIWYALRSDWRSAGQIANLRKGDTLTIEFPIKITVDPKLAKQILKEFLNENCNY